MLNRRGASAPRRILRIGCCATLFDMVRIALALLASAWLAIATQASARERAAVSPELLGNWVITSIRYNDARPPKPVEHPLGISADRIGWDGGCNAHSLEFEIDRRGRVTFGARAQTLRACEPDIPLEFPDLSVTTRWKLEGATLLLIARDRTFVLERSRYSPLSRNEWQLDAIIHGNTGQVRYRVQTQPPVLRIMGDQYFELVDSDGSSSTGTLRAEGERIEAMRYNDETRTRLARSPGSAGFADRLRWQDVTRYRLVDDVAPPALELDAGDETYRFIARRAPE
jgi:heat shock protein HslJ